jgi:hypothetical protein
VTVRLFFDKRLSIEFPENEFLSGVVLQLSHPLLERSLETAGDRVLNS